MDIFPSGVHALRGWRPADSWHCWETSSGLGFKEHGVCTAEKRVQSQVSDPLHPSLPQQTGRPNKDHKVPKSIISFHNQLLPIQVCVMEKTQEGDFLFSVLAPGLRLEFNRRPCSRGVSGPKPGSSEEEVCFQVPQA